MLIKTKYLVILVCSIFLCDGYKILGLFPHASRSHVNVFYPVMEGLARKGHQVTMISYYKYPSTSPNLRQLVLDDIGEDLLASIDMNVITGWRFERYLNTALLAYMAVRTCQNTYRQPIIQDLIKSNDNAFDVVMMEFFNTDCFAPFAYKFQAPLIGLSSCTIMQWSNARFANSYNPAYIPSNNMPYSDKLNFFERVENTLVTIGHEIFMKLMNFHDDRLAATMFDDYQMPSVRDIVKNSSLFLVNSHFSLTLPRPLVPAVINIGGVHVADRVNKLPQELDKWINESTHGVIYFSLGSMIKGHTFPEEKRNEFLKAFGRLPQRILWKWEKEMPNKPDNVRVEKWMPQLDILCHPNVKAFISHGGLLGVTEAVYCGVPIVVMPQYGDQPTNAKAVEANGGGVTLLLHEANEEKVYNALTTVLDPTFRKGAQELSARFRDRPLPPLETAIYWVEYVARHRGAHHMRTAAVDMPFYKYLLLDVIVFLLCCFALTSLLFFYIAKKLLRKLFGTKSNTISKQKIN